MKHSTTRRTLLLPVLALILCAASGAVLAGDETHPLAEMILDAYVEATGGMAAHGKIQNRVTHATFEIEAAGVSAAIKIYSAKPNMVYTLLESDMLGKIEKGTDGETVWEITTMTGPVVKDDPEKAQTLRDASFDRMVYWRDNYDSVKTVGIEEIEGRPCYKVVQTHTAGNDETFYYDKETSLIVKYQSVVQTQMGAIPIEAWLSDHRKIDGILIPHKTTVKVMGQERTITADLIEHNVDLPESRFALPAEIQAIVDVEDGGGKS